MDGRGFTIQVSSTLVTEECYSCHVLFAIPAELRTELLRVKADRSFYCPNGHGQHYTGQTEEQRLQRELERTQRERDWSEAARKRLAEDNMDLAKKNSSLRGSVTRMKNRAKAGMCALCHRTFANYERHVASKHKTPAEFEA